MFYADETTADANEAWSESRREADMEMAEWATQAREMSAREAKGECFHKSGIGYLPKAFYPEAAHLKPGEMLCTDRCKQTVADPFLP